MTTRAGNPRLFRRTCALLALVLVINLAGCVQRRMTIRSNPPGAMVYIDDYQIGTTPVSTDYVYYGTRKIRLVKDGYETLTVYQPMPAPWYQWFGIDFFSENLWPHEIRDERAFTYQMCPMTVVPSDQLIGRAEQLRAASRSVPDVAPAPILPVSAPPVGVPSSAPPIYQVPGSYLPGGAAPTLPPAGLPAPAATFNTPVVPFNSAPGSSVSPPYTYPSQIPANPPAVYPPPGGAAPSPGIMPAVPYGQPNIPPDWRPIGQAPTTIQR